VADEFVPDVMAEKAGALPDAVMVWSGHEPVTVMPEPATRLGIVVPVPP
jgi:hypothetical protein